MDLSNRNIGYGITGSFCTFAKTRKEIQRLTEMGAHVIPIFSYQTQNCDTRFGTAKEFMEEVCDITGNPGIRTLQEAEPIGPKGYLDVMVIAPCTGNSAAKLANAITARKNFGAHSIGKVPPVPATCITSKTTLPAFPISPNETVSV